MIALAISIVAVAAAMQRRARGARIRASEQHPLRAAEGTDPDTSEVILAGIFVRRSRRSRRSDDCLRRGVTSAWQRASLAQIARLLVCPADWA
jgi:hypothetical protein